MSQHESTQMEGAEEAEKTVVGGTVTCPVCAAVNPFGEKWCIDCGFLLSEEPGGPTPELAATAFAALRKKSTASGAAQEGGLLLPLAEGDNPVGRLSGVVSLAEDSYASRQHAVIRVRPPEIWLEDLKSSNGTFVNGERVWPEKAVRLYHGDEVRFAQTTFEVVAPEAGERPLEETPGEAPAVAELIAVEGPMAGSRFALGEGEALLGRQPDARVLLSADGYVSGRHCRLTVRPGEVVVEDLGSRNGTFLNERRLAQGETSVVSPGDKLKVGTTVLELRFLSAVGEGAEEGQDG